MARRARRSLLRRLLVMVLIVVVAIPVGLVGVYRFVPPPLTPLMLLRLPRGEGLDYRWRGLSRVSPALVQAAIGAEDARFCEHHGFDFKAIRQAMAHNERKPGRIRGGSTISQQTAKNVFLWPGRSWVRKGLEAYFTVLIEALWGKRRIMEVYLNVVELGPGIYGAEAAAQRYFGVDAAHLSAGHAARLAAVLPNPLRWSAESPGPYVRRRSRRIGGAIGTVRVDGLAACVGRISRVPADRLPQIESPPAEARPLPPPRPKAPPASEAPASVAPAEPPPEQAPAEALPAEPSGAPAQD
jgi:monofunctional biosynthetic peptidoglycan transglycosylase